MGNVSLSVEAINTLDLIFKVLSSQLTISSSDVQLAVLVFTATFYGAVLFANFDEIQQMARLKVRLFSGN